MYLSDSASMSEDEGKIAPKQSAFALLMGDNDSDAAGSDSDGGEKEEAKPKAQEKAKKVNAMNMNYLLIQH